MAALAVTPVASASGERGSDDDIREEIAAGGDKTKKIPSIEVVAVDRAQQGGSDGGVLHIMHCRSRMRDRRPSHPDVQCRDGARRVFTDRADSACTKREAP